MGPKAYFEPLRSLAFGGISGAYAAVGDPLEHPIIAFCITNNTNGDMIFSLDENEPAGHMFIAAGSYKLYDVQANMNAQFDDKKVLAIGTEFFVKQSTAATSGSVFIEVMF